MPMNRVVLASPDAMPARSRGTEPLKTFTVWPLRRRAPQPETSIPATNELYGSCARATAQEIRLHTSEIARPAVRSARPEKRVARPAVARGAGTIGTKTATMFASGMISDDTKDVVTGTMNCGDCIVALPSVSAVTRRLRSAQPQDSIVALRGDRTCRNRESP